MTSKSNAERAAEATRKAISKIMKPKRRQKGEFRVLGEEGPRDSMWFDSEMASTNQIVFNKKSNEWRKSEKWVKR